MLALRMIMSFSDPPVWFSVPGPRQCEIHKGSYDSLRPLLNGASGGPLTHCADESIVGVRDSGGGGAQPHDSRHI